MNFKGKSILLFSPSFFGYEKAICKRLIELGATVDYFDDRPSNSFWGKALIRIYPKLYSVNTRHYYRDIFARIQERQYDFVLAVDLEAMPLDFLAKIKQKFSSARFILYQWDSIHNKPKTVDYLSYFDAAFSFDKSDCTAYPQMKFRPLFFLNEYKLLAEYTDFAYDLAFVGTAHSDRFALIDAIRKQAQSLHLRCYFYLYLQNWKLFWWHKLTNSDFRKAKSEDFHYVSLSGNQLSEIIKKSHVILDIQHPKQSGLTMRTIEMMGAARKLITTNSAIKEYDFYHPDNICILDRDHPVISEEFFQKGYRPINHDIYKKYSLDGWLNELFTLTQ